MTSGAYWYNNPDWTRTEFREARVSGELVQNCGEFAVDVNGDGYPDIISAGWGSTGINYFENPKQLRAMWPKKKVADTKDLEGMLLVDEVGRCGFVPLDEFREDRQPQPRGFARVALLRSEDRDAAEHRRYSEGATGIL